MNKFKICISILLIMILATTALNVSAGQIIDGVEMTVGVKNDGTWFYTLDKRNNTATICAYKGNEVNLVIPETVEGTYTVTELDLQSTNMGEGMNGFPVFNMYDNKIESLTIPKTLEKITASGHLGDFETGGTVLAGDKVIVERSNFSMLGKLLNIIVDPKNKYFSSVDGVLFNKNKTVLIRYPDGKKDKSYTMPNSVTQIVRDAFYKAQLKELIITENVTEIERIFDTPGNYKYSILNNHLGEKELKKAELLSGKVTVYRDSPAHKYYQTVIKKMANAPTLTVVDNPYIKKDTESKLSSTPKEQYKENASISSSVVTDESNITIGAVDETKKDLKSDEDYTTEILIASIVAILLAGGYVGYFFIKKKKGKR